VKAVREKYRERDLEKTKALTSNKRRRGEENMKYSRILAPYFVFSKKENV